MTKNTLDTCYSIDEIFFLNIYMNFSHIKQSIIVAVVIKIKFTVKIEKNQ